MQDFNKECAASSDKGSEPVVLCSKMVRIAAAFLKETDPEGYEMLCEGLAKANPDSIAFINEHLLKGRTDDAEQADWDLPSLCAAPDIPPHRLIPDFIAGTGGRIRTLCDHRARGRGESAGMAHQSEEGGQRKSHEGLGPVLCQRHEA